jgi:hypothetical protein
MKHLINILIFGLLLSCGHSGHKEIPAPDKSIDSILFETPEVNESHDVQVKIESESLNKEDFHKLILKNEYSDAVLYSLTDTIVADFNGDGNIDKAVYSKDSITSGIIIFHGLSKEVVRIGFGKQLDHLTDFNWVDFWGLVKDKTTHEIIFNESGLSDTLINLNNPSIVLRREEVGGGVITFRKGEYVWIHQAD